MKHRLLTTGVLLVGAMALGAAMLAADKASSAPRASGDVKEFAVTAERFKFDPVRIEVTEGDTVRLTVRSADSTHGFAIKRLKIDKTVPKGGEPVVVEFVAAQPGSFEITCSEYCGRGHSRMKAVLVVSPAAHKE